MAELVMIITNIGILCYEENSKAQENDKRYYMVKELSFPVIMIKET